jgi:hypothetical protein
VEPIPTDDEIRASPAFPRLVRTFQLGNRIFWAGLPFFAAFSIYGATQRAAWALVVSLLLAVGNTGGQLYAFRAERQPLSEISGSPAVQARAKKLAHESAKSRLVRWLPGA